MSCFSETAGSLTGCKMSHEKIRNYNKTKKRERERKDKESRDKVAMFQAYGVKHYWYV